MAVKKVERWATSDGKEHPSEQWANEWESRIDAAAQATELLESGASIACCLQAMDYLPKIDPILERVTKDTQLVISHWQCCDTPGYKVQRFLPDGRVVVYGDAGSWSGPYGGDVTIADLTYYAKARGTLLAERNKETTKEGEDNVA